MKELSELCKEFAIKRCEEICDNLSQESWYIDIQNKIIEKRESICTCSGNNELDDYDDLKLEIMNKIIDETYARAFKDGMIARDLLTPHLTPNSQLQ
jgi:hypothetical protein